MAEPHLNPANPDDAHRLDEELEKALERVRQQARQRAAAARAAQAAAAAGTPAARRATSVPAARPERIEPALHAIPEEAMLHARGDAGAKQPRPDTGQEQPPSTAAATVPPRRIHTRKAEAEAILPKPAAITAAPHPDKRSVRPAFIYALVLALVMTLGASVVRAIHESTPGLDGFAATERDGAGSVEADVPAPPPVTVESLIAPALLRTRGWVPVPGVAAIDEENANPARGESSRAPEIALVPELDIPVDPAAELAAMRAREGTFDASDLPPPPPLVFATPGVFGGIASGFVPDDSATRPSFGNDGNSRLALPPMRIPESANPSGNGTNAQPLAPDGTPLEGGLFGSEPGAERLTNGQLVDNATPNGPLNEDSTGANTPEQTMGNSMLADINRSGAQRSDDARAASPASTGDAETPVATLDTEPSVRPPSEPTLAELQTQRCASAGFFTRIFCNDSVRNDFCENRWNQHPDCQRVDAARNF